MANIHTAVSRTVGVPAGLVAAVVLVTLALAIGTPSADPRRNVEGNEPPNGTLAGDPILPQTFICATSPAHQEVDVELGRPIVIVFCGPPGVNSSSLMIIITPAVLIYGFTFSNNDTTLTVSHSPFQECTMYDVLVVGDLEPGPTPMPWSFYTVCSNPPYAPGDNLTIERL